MKLEYVSAAKVTSQIQTLGAGSLTERPMQIRGPSGSKKGKAFLSRQAFSKGRKRSQGEAFKSQWQVELVECVQLCYKNPHLE